MRSPEEVVFEAEYLRLANDDLRSIMDLISEAAALLMAVPVGLLEVSLLPLPVAVLDPIGRASVAVTETMSKLKEIQEGAIRLGDLVGGRIQAVTNEMHGDDDV